MNTDLAIVVLISLLPIFAFGGCVAFYCAFRLGLVHGGVVASRKQIDLKGITMDKLTGSTVLPDSKETDPFPKFGDIIK